MSRSISFNSFLISLLLNLALLMVLSVIRENYVPDTKESIDVEFSKIPEAKPQRRSMVKLPRSSSSSPQRDTSSPRMNLKITKDIEFAETDSNLPVSIARTGQAASKSPVVSRMPRISGPQQDKFDGQPIGAGASQTGRPSTRRSGNSNVSRNIVPRQPKAGLTGSGDDLRGYYNISLVRYEDTSDTVSTDALKQLAGAMNRWTKVKTKVIKEPINLDGPELLEVPMIYITSQRPFSFSEQERENLGKYMENGGFLLFSNTAKSPSDKQGVEKSIKFELWKVLTGSSYNLVEIDGESNIYGVFFDLPDDLNLWGVKSDGRINVVYEDYGYGAAWKNGQDAEYDLYMKLGVNVIVYALTTSSLVVQEN
ncbi:DUF4159 domain-containing protein [Candidatus Poribacteria bacterium]|nr:DUF4159 domain-containing protein [Candidatus Poribacteria bacterium]